MDFDRIGMSPEDELETVTADMLNGGAGSYVLPEPCPEEMDMALALWNSMEPSSSYERAMVRLFSVLPGNSDIDDVLPKVAVINEFCSQNIRAVDRVARHIISLDVDERLGKGDAALVDDMANVPMSGNRTWNFYSFATKYLSHARPESYPEYDSIIQKVLAYYRDRDGFSRFLMKELRLYSRYVAVISDFRKKYGLEQYSFTEICRFLRIQGMELSRGRREEL